MAHYPPFIDNHWAPRTGWANFDAAKHALAPAGLVLLVPGLILYFISGRMLVDGVKKGRLITTGPYRFCRKPLYAMLILGVIPGVGLMMNSWLMLTVPVVGYLAFRRCIAGEYSEMEQAFGDEFRSYSKATPEFLPWFPKR